MCEMDRKGYVCNFICFMDGGADAGMYGEHKRGRVSGGDNPRAGVHRPRGKKKGLYGGRVRKEHYCVRQNGHRKETPITKGNVTL